MNQEFKTITHIWHPIKSLTVTKIRLNAKFKDLDITAIEFTSMVDLYILRLNPLFFSSFTNAAQPCQQHTFSARPL
jgi:hypothetical protein